MIDQEFVKYIISALVNKPDEVKVERTIDERGVLLTLHVASEDLGRVIGRKGSTAQSLRTLLRALGSKNEAHYNLRIADENSSREESYSPRNAEKPAVDEVENSPASQEADSSDEEEIVNEFAQDTPAESDKPASSDSLLKQTQKELDDLNDLDL
ncbi:MAG: KH domain-containing protein [Candidatus Saccharibacteria bacterium]|nr:KH domain-containing protein [Candidatus Saccharibacteria bacterium]